MPLDVLGRTRATLVRAASFITWLETAGQSANAHRDWDRPLQFLVVNEEFLVNASHQLALITSLPFVHTARRSYRFEWFGECSGSGLWLEKLCKPYHLEEG